MKQNRIPRQNRAAGFTLVEMLVVIAIIAILASILIPVIARSKTKAKVATARVQMAEIDLAIKSYKSDYERYPMPMGQAVNSFGDVTFGDGFKAHNNVLMAILFSEDTSSHPLLKGVNDGNRRNPKKNKYLDAKESGESSSVNPALPGVSREMRYHDPFGNDYIVSMDKNGDGYCVDAFYGGLPNGALVGLKSVPKPGVGQGYKGGVIIWTNGPDLERKNKQGVNDGVNADNIVNWN